MDDDLAANNARGFAATTVWEAACKDCQAEQFELRNDRPTGRGKRTARKEVGDSVAPPTFKYSDSWARRTIERGNSRSDRCERHRKAHRSAIQAISVAYIDLCTIGEVADRQNPTGPLGGLGPLPAIHRKQNSAVDLGGFELGMSDEDILQLLDGLTRKRVAVVEAGTGTGKSTFMPFRLMSAPSGAAIRLTDSGPIIVTEPRKAAAKGVAAFVGESMCFGHDPRTCTDHIGPGFPVGYQVSGDRNWDSACQLIYVTDGTMINWVREGRLATIGTVIVDEAHERSENIDIILAQLRDQLRRFEHLRVIITSATIDKNFFIEYFGGTEQVFYQKVEARKSFGYGVPFFIGTEISDAVIEHGLVVEPGDGTSGLANLFEGWSEVGQSVNGGPPEDLRATTRKLRELPRPGVLPVEQWKDLMPRALANQIVDIAAGTQHGDILGFLPTSEAINEAVKAIKDGLEPRGLDFDVYPLLSTTPENIRDRALESRSRGEKRKIVVSSNLAETSLTVKGVRYVVDSGLICQPEWDPTIASGTYPTKAHSQSGLRQRWGRVGRDSPGWVFPLYTLEQFRSQAKNTPPGSTQTNLEIFYMKLLSAGIDIDNVSLPANFVHKNVECDEEARRNIETFNLESIRAKHTLIASGAVDLDGHLTEFGRELERFPGSGARAVAIMLADQLACVHEVALALAVLGDNRLVGSKQGLFRFDREWPAAWRVHATRCHRALATDCCDDLDILIRVVSEWQATEDPEEWCATWWVNQQALIDAQAVVAETISALSPGMRSAAERTVMPMLADRARAVIIRAMGSDRYERVVGNTYKSSREGDLLGVKLDRSAMVDPGDRIIALNRFRPGRDSDGKPQDPIIANTIRILDWMEDKGAGSDDLGFDLAVSAAKVLRDRSGKLKAVSNRLSAIRSRFPVGIIVDLVLGERLLVGTTIEEITFVQHSFGYPGEPASKDNAVSSTNRSQQATRLRSSVPSGYDPDWDPFANPHAEIPPEEASQGILNVQDLETNDTIIDRKLPSKRDLRTASFHNASDPLPKLCAIAQHKTSELKGQMRVEVVGYQPINQSTVALVIEPVARDGKTGDPAQHADLKYGDSVELEVRGPVSDHEYELVELSRADGRGRFYLGGQGIGIDTYDRDFVRRLQPGARLMALVIPDWNASEVFAVSLLPTAVAHLETAIHEQLPVSGEMAKFYYAAIVEGLNQWNKLVVELDHRDATTGLSHRFAVWNGHCAKLPSVEVGQRMLVALGRDSRGRRRSLKADVVGMLDLAARNTADLRVMGNEVHAVRPSVPLNVIHEILALNDTPAWHRDVWLFHVDNLHMDAIAVQPITSRRSIRFPAELTALIMARKPQIGQRHRVSITIDETRATLEIVGADPSAIESAEIEMVSIAALPFVVAKLPFNSIGALIGRGGETIRRLQSRINVLDVHLENDKVTVIAENGNAVTETINEIKALVTKVTGELVVPAGKNGFLIGKGGLKIRNMCEMTGCQAENPGKGQKWTLEGSTENGVRAFIRMAAEVAPGTTGRVSQIKTLQIIADTTKTLPTAKHPKGAPGGIQPSARGTDDSPEDSRVGGMLLILAVAGILLLIALAAIYMWK